MGEQAITFSFGENWGAFVATHFDQERVATAQRHLLNFLDRPNLVGKTFLDAGSGSGLHSLAALRAGAERIISFDVDPASVRTTDHLRQMEENPAHWVVLHGSVLDECFLATLEPADVVYSWGVLHHTGNMREAVRNVSRLMKPDGVFYVSLYRTTPRSAYWLEVKRRYNRASRWEKRAMEAWYVARHGIIPDLIRLRNPIRPIREYRHRRGMSYLTDVRDWLGGYPYEHVSVEEVVRFSRSDLNLELANLNIGPTLAEYLLANRPPRS